MRKSWPTRMAAIGGVVTAMVVATAGVAMADNKSIGDEHGTMTFIDDGDVFRVCDTMKDDHGVTGYLEKSDNFHSIVLTVNDGGDSGCDKAGFNIGNFWQYRMILVWNGQQIASSGWFNE